MVSVAGFPLYLRSTAVQSGNDVRLYDPLATGGATTHDCTGILTGQGSTIVGSAKRFRAHAATGALTGQGSTIVGSANRTRVHSTSGVLTGQGSLLSGSARRFRAHTCTGALAGAGSAINGAVNRTRVHAATGALNGQGSAIAGSAQHIAKHQASGVLVGQGSIVVGSASRTGVAVTHACTGALIGQGSIISGSANHISPNASVPKQGGDDAPRGIYYQDQPKRKVKRSDLDQLLDDSVAEYYQAIEESNNPELISEVSDIVKPYIDKNEINWVSLREDIQAVRLLLELYQQYLDEQDEEEILILLLSG